MVGPISPPTAAMCQGKVKFDNFTLASQAAKRCKDKSRNAYKCIVCQGYHIGRNRYVNRKKSMLRKAADQGL